MCDPLSRRELLALGVLTSAASFVPQPLPAGISQRTPESSIRARPFDLHSVRLRPGPMLDALEVNRGYLMRLDPARLLHMFRLTAGLPSSARPLGGWEAPDNELRGHFTGHFMSACALIAAQTGDAAARSRGIEIADELAKCQRA